MVTHPGTNRVWRSATTLIEANALPLSQTANHYVVEYTALSPGYFIPFFCLLQNLWSDVLKMNELILMKIGTSGRRGKYTSGQLWGSWGHGSRRRHRSRPRWSSGFFNVQIMVNLFDAADVEMRAGESVSVDEHQTTMTFHQQTTLSAPMRSD